jgi:hypothetical protein
MWQKNDPDIFPMRALLSCVLLFCMFCLGSCSKSHVKQTKNGIYVWDNRSYYRYFDSADISFLKQNSIDKIYFKLLDADWDEFSHAYPTDVNESPVYGYDSFEANYFEYVPCLFFTNTVMLRSTKPELEYMAQKIAEKLSTFKYFSEYQVDCDWSEQSRENYFYFLGKLKSLLKDKKLSVTIRLFQFRYPDKAGVPPANRGMLMLYNFSSPKEFKEQNSIFDEAEGKKYVTSKAYPLPLDIVLPSFSWAALYGPDKKFQSLLHADLLSTIPEIAHETAKNIYTVNRDTVVQNIYFRKGDLIKMERTEAQQLKEAAALADSFTNNSDYTLSIFALNEGTIQLFKTADVKKVYDKAAH